MGFWHTTHSSLTVDDFRPELFQCAPQRFSCRNCSQAFISIDDLRRHRFEHHPIKRPILSINGIELGNTEHYVHTRIDPKSIDLEYAESIEMNGHVLTTNEFRHKLETLEQDTVNVTLVNKDALSRYRICIEVASELDLFCVEEEFLRMRNLTLRDIRDFTDISKSHKTAKRYVDGISRYLYGMEKLERLNETNDANMYYENFNQACDFLRSFNRPIANFIKAIIAFHFNHFEDCSKLLVSGRLAAVSGYFLTWIEENSTRQFFYNEHLLSEKIEDFLINSQTIRIIKWALNLSNCDKRELSETLKSPFTSNYDRLKLRMFLAIQAERNKDVALAKEYAGQLRNDPTVGEWAQKILDRVRKLEEDYVQV